MVTTWAFDRGLGRRSTKLLTYFGDRQPGALALHMAVLVYPTLILRLFGRPEPGKVLFAQNARADVGRFFQFFQWRDVTGDVAVRWNSGSA